MRTTAPLLEPGRTSADHLFMPDAPPHADRAPLSGHAPAPTSEQLQTLMESQRLAKPLARAARVGAFNGWTAGIFGACSLMGGFFSLPALLLGVGLCAAAWNELRHAKALADADTNAPRRLALNQGVIFLVLSGYAGWQLATALRSGNSSLVTGDPIADDVLRPYADLAQDITIGVYSLVIVVTGFVQGAMAWYYLSRQSAVAAYHTATPAWARSLHERRAA